MELGQLARQSQRDSENGAERATSALIDEQDTENEASGFAGGQRVVVDCVERYEYDCGDDQVDGAEEQEEEEEESESEAETDLEDDIQEPVAAAAAADRCKLAHQAITSSKLAVGHFDGQTSDNNNSVPRAPQNRPATPRADSRGMSCSVFEEEDEEESTVDTSNRSGSSMSSFGGSFANSSPGEVHGGGTGELHLPAASDLVRQQPTAAERREDIRWQSSEFTRSDGRGDGSSHRNNRCAPLFTVQAGVTGKNQQQQIIGQQRASSSSTAGGLTQLAQQHTLGNESLRILQQRQQVASLQHHSSPASTIPTATATTTTTTTTQCNAMYLASPRNILTGSVSSCASISGSTSGGDGASSSGCRSASPKLNNNFQIQNQSIETTTPPTATSTSSPALATTSENCRSRLEEQATVAATTATSTITTTLASPPASNVPSSAETFTVANDGQATAFSQQQQISSHLASQQQQESRQEQHPLQRQYPPNHPLGNTKHLCSICGDRATGKHYGVYSCEGCKGFFKRTIRKDIVYVCRSTGNCLIDMRQRNRCQYCRYQKCLRQGMKREAVQEEKQRLKLRAAAAQIGAGNLLGGNGVPLGGQQMANLAGDTHNNNLNGINDHCDSSRVESSTGGLHHPQQIGLSLSNNNNVVISSSHHQAYNNQNDMNGHLLSYNSTNTSSTTTTTHSGDYNNDNNNLLSDIYSNSFQDKHATHQQSQQHHHVHHRIDNLNHLSQHHHHQIGKAANSSPQSSFITASSTNGNSHVNFGALNNSTSPISMANNNYLAGSYGNQRLSNGTSHRLAVAREVYCGGGYPHDIVFSPSAADYHHQPRKYSRIDNNTLRWAAQIQIEQLIDWAKSVPRFTELLIEDQITLLKSYWNELIISDIAFKSVEVFKGNQAGSNGSLSLCIGRGLYINETQAGEIGLNSLLFGRIFCELVAKMHDMGVDANELACLRAIILFNPETHGLKSSQPIEEHRGNVYTALELYCRKHYEDQPNRFGKLLLRLPALRSIGLLCDPMRRCDSNSTSNQHHSLYNQHHHHNLMASNNDTSPMNGLQGHMIGTTSPIGSNSNSSGVSSSAGITGNGTSTTSTGVSPVGSTTMLGLQLKLLFFELCYEASSIDSFLKSSLMH